MTPRIPAIKAAALSGAVFLSALGTSAPAQTYAVEGPGRLSCAEFTKLQGDEFAEQLRNTASWLTGYLTAHHRLMPEVFDLSPWQTPSVLMGLVRQFCVAQPQANVELAAAELVRYLAPRAMEEPSPMVGMQNEDRVTLLYEVVLDQIRAALIEAGFDPGTQSAEFAQALEDFQKANAIPASGLPDQHTLTVLLGNN